MSEKTNHYEILSCGHQNNLLIIQSDGKRSKPGICPKGCNNVSVTKVVTVDVQLAQIEITPEL